MQWEFAHNYETALLNTTPYEENDTEQSQVRHVKHHNQSIKLPGQITVKQCSYPEKAS